MAWMHGNHLVVVFHCDQCDEDKSYVLRGNFEPQRFVNVEDIMDTVKARALKFHKLAMHGGNTT